MEEIIMKKSFLKVFALTSAMVMAMGMAGYGSAESGSGSTEDSGTLTIRLGDMPYSYSIVFEYAQAKGFFDKAFEGEDVEFKVDDFLSGPVLNESVSAGETDIGVIGAVPFISGTNNGYEYKVVAKSDTTHYFPMIVSKGSGITSVSDLKGKAVGTTVGGQYHYLLLRYLNSAGLTADDLEIVNSTSDTPTLLRSGDIVATAYNAAMASQLVDEGAAEIIADDPGDVMANYIIATDEFASEHPDELVKVLEATSETIDYINENPDEYVAYLKEKSDMDEKYLKVFADTQKFEISLTDEDFTSFENVTEFLKEQGTVTDESYNAADYVDTSFLEKIGK
jgi:sulfonate transport system substrate-binding protein